MTRAFFSSTFALIFAAGLAATSAEAQLKVVTSTPDLSAIAAEVGGNKVTTRHVSEGYQDPHFVEAKPSFVLQLRNADVWAFVGLGLEVGWMPLLLDGARNPRIRPGATGYVDVSRSVRLLDIPAGDVDRSQGDVHPLGNPHYWLHPENGRRIARMFQQKFSELDPKNAASYAANERAFETRLDAAERGWRPSLSMIAGKPVAAWHTSWRYFADYTKMNIVGFMEPKPGVPPSPAHLAGLIQTMKRTGAKIIIMEPFYSRKTADFVASKSGAKVLVLPPSVGGVRGVNDYVALMKSDIEKVAAALR
ncbi:MAG: zinc ABC transporter substrate-binding protein [Gemmatimonadaceae bacterium]|nr:zinc ABC transporter substrate-binding protein [Gemmatimonadaceae bacterium]